MIKFNSPHFLRVLDVALNGKHSLLIITSDVYFIQQVVFGLKKTIPEEQRYLLEEIIYVKKPCPCGNFNSTNRICKCTPEEIKKYQINLPQTDMTFTAINCFNFEYLEFDKSKIDKEGLNLLETAYKTKGMLPSELETTLRVAKTISEIDKEDNIKTTHIAEALQYVLGKEFYL
ncbi:MAG: ATP-binding protein [Candidatus Heimdallarchaeaceae archaeon]